MSTSTTPKRGRPPTGRTRTASLPKISRESHAALKRLVPPDRSIADVLEEMIEKAS